MTAALSPTIFLRGPSMADLLCPRGPPAANQPLLSALSTLAGTCPIVPAARGITQETLQNQYSLEDLDGTESYQENP